MMAMTIFMEIVSVVELSDLITTGIITVWLFWRKPSKEGKMAYSFFKNLVNAYLIFMLWIVLTTSLTYFFIDNPVNVLLMYARIIKHAMYAFMIVIFILEFSRTKNNSCKYFFIGLALSLIVHVPIQVQDTASGPAKLEKALEKKGRIVKASKYGIKNVNSNLSATFLIFIFSILFRKKNIFLLALFILLIAAIYLSTSRSSWVMTFSGFLMLLLFSGKKRKSIKKQQKKIRKRLKTAVILSIVGITIFALNSDYIHRNLFESKYKDPITYEDSYTGGRYNLAKEGLKSILWYDYLIGVGFYSRFYQGRDRYILGTHNTYVQILWEAGIVGLVLFLNIFYQLWLISKSLLRKTVFSSYFNVIMFVALLTGLSGEFYYGPMYFFAQFMLMIFAILYYDEIGDNRLHKILQSGAVYE